MTKGTMEAVDQVDMSESTSTSDATLYIPSPNAVDISPNQDRGVLKEILKSGVGSETPNTGAKVFVHYTGKLLDGTVFDSSRDRSEFEFTLGRGEVIKAWDIGVSTMCKGETCILVCAPEYAYGSAGSSPKIPANATLVFEVELLKWQFEDLSPSKDGGIQKIIVTQGEGYSTPNDDSTVEIHLTGHLGDMIFEERDVKFELDEASEQGIVKGIEIAVKSLKKNETAKILLSPKYAFGEEGNSALNIPPNTDIEYDVTLKAFENAKESWNMNSDEKVEQSEIVKNKGTIFFKKEKYDLASKQYQKIISYLQFESISDEEKEKEKNSLLLAGYLNLAACNLKLQQYQDAIKNCNKALELDEKNVKALFRRGQALVEVREYDDAKVDFQNVLKIDATNKAAQQQLFQCNMKIKQLLDKEKKTYKNMFEKFAKQDAKKTEKNDEADIILTDENKEVVEPIAM